MTQRIIQPQTAEAALPGVPLAIALAVLVVLVLITVQPGAGIGFA